MACINQGEPITPRVKFRTVQKIKTQKYISDQAYLIPENGGTAVYLSYELNRTLENIFNNYSINGYMGVNEFVKMCYEYNLLPKNRNRNILYYIFKSSKPSDEDYIEYRFFFQLLQKLSAYLFRKLIMTEQEKLNVLIKHLTSLCNSKISTHKEKYNVGIQVSVRKENKGTNAVCDMIDQCCDTSVEVKSVATAMDTMDSMNDKDNLRERHVNQGREFQKEKDEVSDENNNGNTSHTQEITISDEQKMKERINEIEKLSIHKEDMNERLKEEINNALNIIKEKNKVIENMKKSNIQQLEAERVKIIHLKNEIQKLQNEKGVVDLNKESMSHSSFKNGEEETTHRNDITTTDMQHMKWKILDNEHLKLKRLLVLPGEEEAALIKVFSAYSTYCGETAEYVMSKRNCANFLATYYLLRKNGESTAQEDLDVKTADILFNEVLYKRAHAEKTNVGEGVLTYFYFKLFLSRLGKHLYPQLEEREGFLEIVLNYILVMKRNEDFKNWKKKSIKIKKKNKIRIACSDDLNLFGENIVGGYTSSEKGTTCDKLKKKKEKAKQNTDNITNNLLSENGKTAYSHTDLSFEYIESNEAKKKMNTNKSRENSINKMHEERLNHNAADGNTNASTTRTTSGKGNFLKSKLIYNNLIHYDEVSKEGRSSLDSVQSDDFALTCKKKNALMQPLKIKHNFNLSKKHFRNLTSSNMKPNSSLKNMFPLYDIEGELWHSKSERKKTFLPQFGRG
ncbi:conserved Plasmodium protein, unknown function [Plasmodium knowlesi strain H]|uniref:Uncharacterized protein n=3 Tax=Plasmodium knowlesi TaxID=5850 RepID=A0A5K1TWL8_PLAKH|nr:conserved Plasmodium protein, unknown function [Plasmodium knowlesi strain H]OTN63972.1 Uncharacterized protein PKNOH_S140258500 [Plasmodium knowlesi]CAA9991000.1 conserved Plasmodium protein, unknown function [Plasmodium knowlesi strain H]SBO20736.1 conserved Plasmodium protein, unknown function [Plasmodium knowlesi strain H]SBO21183.1 conserved Plasmodium protein, unknown function [Plasmodium knowlesi strain H]VVS80474.1 conserved Plasmodium protein, unknown function [Plasmodium knowlesi |eukprot:XP_002262283.1 hypothetical protein, conserved in Plasmodium species [Plasmodium knowlesi strain H]